MGVSESSDSIKSGTLSEAGSGSPDDMSVNSKPAGRSSSEDGSSEDEYNGGMPSESDCEARSLGSPLLHESPGYTC